MGQQNSNIHYQLFCDVEDSPLVFSDGLQAVGRRVFRACPRAEDPIAAEHTGEGLEAVHESP